MTIKPSTNLARVLGDVEKTGEIADLAAVFYDQTAVFRLAACGSSAPVGIGAHLRRSFLGAMGQAASSNAMNNHPCTWDPPCALDVFKREQMRGPRGDGLPKPYVIDYWINGTDLMVSLRVFGMANDWFMTGAEAMATGIRSILPWQRLYPGRKSAPDIISRQINSGALVATPDDATTARLVFYTPTDISGTDPFNAPHKILSRMLRRVDGVSRWNGIGLTDSAGRKFARFVENLDYDMSDLITAGHISPNAQGQTRHKRTMTGKMVIRGDLTQIWPVLAMGARCHLGRGAVEGLGAFIIE